MSKRRNDESGGEEERAVSNEEVNDKSRKTKKKLKAMHLADDLRNIQEAVQLYKSNIFKMEIDELLAELRIDEAKMKPVEKILHRLKELVDGIAPTEALLLPDAEKLLAHAAAVPFADPKPQKDVQYRFRYAQPADFSLVGAYSLKTVIKTPERFAIDVVVTMPADIFTDKDILNYRYFHKRAFYLAYLATQLTHQFDVSYEYLDGDRLRPVLRLESLKDGSEYDFHKAKCYIRLIPGIAKDVFNHAKLSGTHNCVRYSQDAVETLKPTPYYNASILSDMQFYDSTVFLHKAAKSCDGFRDACKLAHIWLKQRGFSSAVDGGGFGPFEFGALAATLLITGGSHGSRVLSAGFSNYQLFKATLSFIAANDLVETAVAVAEPGPRTGLPRLVNNTIGLNVLWRMTPASYEKLRHEAKITVKELDDVNGDHFDSVFLDKVDNVIYQYDLTLSYVASLANPLTHRIKFPQPQKAYRELDRVFTPSYYSYFTSKVHRVLRTGLGERASLVSVKFAETSVWDLHSRKPALGPATFELGLVLNPEHSERLVTHGPEAENKAEAESFRNFWGQKSELRRFKDGSITESVVWTARRDMSVAAQIVVYLLERHFGIGQVAFVGEGLENVFARDSQVGDPAAFANFQKLLDQFEALRKLLIDVDSLPLRVSTVMPACAALRYASVRSPAPEADAASVHDFADVVIELETSAKWPDDLTAVQHSKAAFLLAIADSVTRADPEIVASVGLDRDPATVENFAFLDIVLNGFGFRVRISTERELAMLRGNPDLAPALRNFERSFSLRTRHSTEFQTMCHRFPFLSPSVRRVKKWFNAHMLSPHVDDVLIELLTLAVFLRPHPWTPPASATVGFLRTIRMLAHWDWRTDPLVLDVDGSLSIQDIQSVRDAFKALRAHDAAHAAATFVAVNYERTGIAWSASKVVAARVTALARASCAALKAGAGADSIFASPHADFDFVIHLRAAAAADGSRCDYAGLYFEELRAVFGDSVLLFRNASATDAILGVWDPRVLEDRGWKVYLGYSSRPSGPGKVTANARAMVREMERLGGDLVARIDMKVLD